MTVMLRRRPNLGNAVAVPQFPRLYLGDQAASEYVLELSNEISPVYEAEPNFKVHFNLLCAPCAVRSFSLPFLGSEQGNAARSFQGLRLHSLRSNNKGSLALSADKTST